MKRLEFLLKSRAIIQSRTIFTQLYPGEITQPLIKCRDRPFLAGGHSKKLPEYLPREVNQFFTGIKVEEGLQKETKVEDIGKEFRQYIDANIDRYSAFLLKGALSVPTIEDFNKLISSIGYRSHFYDAGTAARSTVGDVLYTASDEPPEISIESHNEMSYLKNQPNKVLLASSKVKKRFKNGIFLLILSMLSAEIRKYYLTDWVFQKHCFTLRLVNMYFLEFCSLSDFK